MSTMPLRCRLPVVAAALAACGVAAAQPANLLSKLRSGGEVTCQPAHPVFCANVHVTCVGPTRVASFPFRLRANETSGAIEAPEDAAPENAATMGALYERAGATWDAATESLILRPRDAQGYIRLHPDGRYTFRFYVGAAGVMSLGRCE
ncbi:MAG: hypothetical protein JNN03_15480 [Rubrivivax sp.]|nr:hypothetical protein [Rubrivivax sp.]